MSSASSYDSETEYINNNIYVIKYDQDVLNFFCFGCWNKDECKENNPFSKVLKSIGTSSRKYNFGIVSGDNIYADKDKDGIKKFNKQKFSDGLQCLQKLNYPIYSVLGNHDIESCEVYSTEIKNYPFWFLQNYYSLLLILNNFKVLMLYIDCNLFEDEEELKDTCYKNLKVGKLKTDMCEWVENQLETYNDCKYVFIIAHEPLFGYKYKKKGEKEKLVTDFPKFSVLFDILFNFNKKYSKDIYYLCAHLHNFQKIEIIQNDDTVKNKIYEIISGTGGAEPDIIKDKIKGDINTEEKTKSFLAKMTEKQDAYGYVDFEISEHKCNFEYIKVISAEEYIK